MLKRVLLFICLCHALSLFGQRRLIELRKFNGAAELDFSYVNNFIVVDVVMNGFFPLKFIFDTGAENTLLLRKELTDILQVNYNRRITIYGSDLSTELYAYVAPGIQLDLGEQLRIHEQALLVLQEDYFRMEEYIGIGIHGILGGDILRRFVVHIDYQRQKIILQDPSKFNLDRYKNAQPINAEFSRTKPYLFVPADLWAGQQDTLKLLMDSGANIAMLLYINQDSSLTMPDNLIRTTIARGLGGSLQGFVGRATALDVGSTRLNNVVVNFQDVAQDYVLDTTFLNNRNGVLGNKTLDRFYIIIDYIRERVYIKPNRSVKLAFNYDRSGLVLATTGEQLNTYSVISVVEGSPAQKAGIQKGDSIKSINGRPCSLVGLDGVVRMLRKPAGKKVKLVVRRGEERIKCNFTLQDLI